MAQNLSNLPVGAKVKFGTHSIEGETAQPIIWRIVAKNHPGYPSDSITLLTERIIDLRVYDAGESNVPGSSDNVGNNEYGLSNIDQWLNSTLNDWWGPTHTYDNPPTQHSTTNKTGYEGRPGFLYNFADGERKAILSTSIDVTKYGGTVESLTRKVFLPSITELGLSVQNEPVNGSVWSYFSTNGSEAVLTEQCLTNTRSTIKPADTKTAWSYWSRSASSTAAALVYYCFFANSTNMAAQTVAHSDNTGVRPALNLSSTIQASDTTDSDGCYTIIAPNPPSPPDSIWYEDEFGGNNVYVDRPFTIRWSPVDDTNGGAVSYELEVFANGVNVGTVETSSTSHTMSVSSAWGGTPFYAKVRAISSRGEIGEYREGSVVTIINNTSPYFTESNDYVGTHSSPFSFTYGVADKEGDELNWTVKLNGELIMSGTRGAGSSSPISISIQGANWLKLSNSMHYIDITVTDGIFTITRQLRFRKLVSSLSISTVPIVSSTQPIRIKVDVERELPTEAIFKVEVSNNAKDSNPTWEDITSNVKGNMAHVFTNTTKTASTWGVSIRVTVDRNGGVGACYISSIGGNWE